MVKTCIICKGLSGSGEHVFPAAFGGRRTNRGIYCEKDNNTLGKHVSVLLESLDVMNAIIGVRPDRHEKVRPAPVEGDDGKTYLLSKNHVGLAPPLPLDKSVDYNGTKMTLAFESEQEAHKWIAEQRNNGFKIAAVETGQPQTKFFSSPLTASKMIGGEAFFRAVAYIALTFFAHHFPAAARSAKLEGFKNMVMGKSSFNNEVWWLPFEDLATLPATPFATSHTVAVAFSKKTGLATAMVSLFGAISFGVSLGEVDHLETRRVTTHINPLADKAPEDIVTIREQGVHLELSTHSEGQKYLQAVVAGEVPNPFIRHTAEASNAQVKETVERLLPILIAANDLPHQERSQAIAYAMSTQRQRVFNILREGVTRFSKVPDLPTWIYKLSEALIAPDEANTSGLSREAEVALIVATQVVNAKIEQRLNEGSLDRAALSELLGGGSGVALIFSCVVQPLIMNNLPD